MGGGLGGLFGGGDVSNKGLKHTNSLNLTIPSPSASESNSLSVQQTVLNSLARQITIVYHCGVNRFYIDSDNILKSVFYLVLFSLLRQEVTYIVEALIQLPLLEHHL